MTETTDEFATRAFGALSHQARLRIFRALVPQGASGMCAGDLAQVTGMSPTATSFHLKELERAGLIQATRDGRYMRYAINPARMRELIAFLTEDCCQGHPELCGVSLSSQEAVGSQKVKGGSHE